jgi:hypothetical protein
MHFHIVKMYKDKEVKKNVKDIGLELKNSPYDNFFFLFINLQVEHTLAKCYNEP